MVQRERLGVGGQGVGELGEERYIIRHGIYYNILVVGSEERVGGGAICATY